MFNAEGPWILMPLSSRLQKKRSSDCLDHFADVGTGWPDKNNSAEIDGCLHCKTVSHDRTKENRAMQKSTWHMFKWVRKRVISEIMLLM